MKQHVDETTKKAPTTKAKINGTHPTNKKKNSNLKLNSKSGPQRAPRINKLVDNVMDPKFHKKHWKAEAGTAALVGVISVASIANHANQPTQHISNSKKAAEVTFSNNDDSTAHSSKDSNKKKKNSLTSDLINSISKADDKKDNTLSNEDGTNSNETTVHSDSNEINKIVNSASKVPEVKNVESESSSSTEKADANQIISLKEDSSKDTNNNQIVKPETPDNSGNNGSGVNSGNSGNGNNPGSDGNTGNGGNTSNPGGDGNAGNGGNTGNPGGDGNTGNGGDDGNTGNPGDGGDDGNTGNNEETTINGGNATSNTTDTFSPIKSVDIFDENNNKIGEQSGSDIGTIYHTSGQWDTEFKLTGNDGQKYSINQNIDVKADNSVSAPLEEQPGAEQINVQLADQQITVGQTASLFDDVKYTHDGSVVTNNGNSAGILFSEKGNYTIRFKITSADGLKSYNFEKKIAVV